MLVIYNKNNGEIVHYVDHDGKVEPTLFGLYHACIKKNYPNSSLDDFGEMFIDGGKTDENKQSMRSRIFQYSKMKIKEEKGKPVNIEFIEKGKSDPPEKNEQQKQKEKMDILEKKLEQQQELIDKLIKNKGI